MKGIREYKPICTIEVPPSIGKIYYYPSTGYIISPVTTRQWEDYKHLQIGRFVEVIGSCVEFSNLVDYVYEYQLEKGKYSKEEIRECYQKFMREMYVLCKEDKVEDGNSVALPSSDND